MSGLITFKIVPYLKNWQISSDQSPPTTPGRAFCVADSFTLNMHQKRPHLQSLDFYIKYEKTHQMEETNARS